MFDDVKNILSSVALLALGSTGLFVVLRAMISPLLARMEKEKPKGDMDDEDRLVAEVVALIEKSREDKAAILESIEVFNKDCWKRHERQVAAMDSMANSMDELATSQKAFLRAMLGDTVIPTRESPEEDPEVEEAARKLMRRYGNGITREEAIERARQMFVYRDGQGMGGRA